MVEKDERADRERVAADIPLTLKARLEAGVGLVVLEIKKRLAKKARLRWHQSKLTINQLQPREPV
jgi:hypothetical protein